MAAGFFDLFIRRAQPPAPVASLPPLRGLSRILVADIYGRVLAQLDGAEIQEVTWRLLNIGKCAFTIARTDAKAIERHLNFGNRVFVEFDNGLPNWGGMIWMPREWARDRISVTCYSMEQMLQKRQTGKSVYYTDQPVGEIFKDTLLATEQVSSLGLRMGNIAAGDSTHSVEYHYQDVLWVSQTSLTRNLSNMEYRFRPVLEDGIIYFYADILPKLGARRPNTGLIAGHNVLRVKFREQGPLHNWIDLAGEGSGWGDDRITAHAESAESIGKHGLQQHAEVQGGVSELSTLERNADLLLEENEWPAPVWDVSAINLAPGAFRNYDLGDEVRFMSPYYGFGGFDGFVRVLGRSYRGATGECDLIVEQVLDAE